MKKIPSLFQRNYETDRLVRDEVVPGSEWVLDGEGVPTRKLDGTCCMVKDGVLFKRHDVKKGRTKPYGFISAQEPDPVTGHWPGWVEVGNGNEDKWHREAFRDYYINGTYELVGPKIQGNPENRGNHNLVPHGAETLEDFPRSYPAIKEWFRDKDIEGIVWHHSDGKMVKIKKKDFFGKR